jgi:hypothetical protein
MKIFGLSLSLLFHCALLLPGCAAASQQDMAVTGVWSGAIGTSRITACFGKRSEDGRIVRSFYDVRDLGPIVLEAQSSDGKWIEHGTDGPNVWTIASLDDAGLTGTWRKRSGMDEMPILLHRVPGAGNDNACGGEVYNAPLEAKFFKLVIGPVTSMSPEKRYRKISSAGMQTVELIDSSPAIASVNRQLRGELSLYTADAGSIRTQLRESMQSNGFYIYDITTTSPVAWNERWITMSMHRQFGGTGASGADSGYRTWDARTGREIDPRKWLGVNSDLDEARAFPPVGRTGVLPERLRRYLLRSAKIDKKCRAVFSESVEAGLKLSQDGIEFKIGDSYNPECMQGVFLTFAQLQPFLNGEGRAALRAMAGK